MAETTKPYPSPEKLSEQLVNLCWRIAVELRAIYTTVQTKISQSDADKLYLGIKGKAVSATTADSATKATQDGSGNVISQTYAKTSALPTAMKGATASAAGSAGTVPAPEAGANAKYLRGDGTWQTPTNTTYNVMTAATSSAAGASGLVPAPAAGKQAQYLRGDGTWATPTNTTYNVMTAATASAAGAVGLVPQPSAGANAKFLRGDGTWQTVLTSQTKADWNATSGDGVINNKPTIPTATSDLINDSGFITSSAIPTVDASLSTTSTNAVQNKAVANALAGKMAATPAFIEFQSVGSSAGYGGYIDFHYNGSTADYTSRIIEDASGKVSITAANGLYVNGNAVVTRSSSSTTDVYITSTYHSGASWYRVWSDGFIEQGGKSGAGGTVTVTLPKAFTTTQYQVLVSDNGSNGEKYDPAIIISSTSVFRAYSSMTSAGCAKFWVAFGY